jgi:hypothetical protein
MGSTPTNPTPSPTGDPTPPKNPPPVPCETGEVFEEETTESPSEDDAE